jgi:hypothetical protein
MRKVQVEFSNGSKDTMYGEGETDTDAARDVGERIQRAMRGDWGGLGVEINPHIRTWYISLQWAIASCGDISIKVEK